MSVAAFAGVAPCSSVLTGCPSEPLRDIGGGKFVSLSGNRTTTCSEHSQGSCPYAVAFPDFPCLVNCLASDQACAAANQETPAVDRFVDKTRCTSCHITACAECFFDAPGRSKCVRCFPGFVGVDGAEGAFGSCVLWDHNFVLRFFLVLFGLVGLIFFVILAATCVTAYKMTWGAVIGGMMESISFEAEEIHSPQGDSLSHPLMAEQQKVNMGNSAAIHKGLMLSLMSSIKASAMRRAASGPKNLSVWGKIRSALKGMFDDRMTDLGLGLQLFFKTQIFLILVSAIVYAVASGLEDGQLFQALDDLSLCAAGNLGSANLTATYVVGGERYAAHAKKMQFMCSFLWFVLIIVSFLFHISQRQFVEEYDKHTYSAEDYTLRLQGLSTHITSEKALKLVLEHEFRCHLYGVSICYNLKRCKDPHKIHEMTEHIIEWDDLKQGWVAEEVATPKPELKRMLDQDSAELQDLLNRGELRGSGTAYVVFRTQKDLFRVSGEHRGISQDVFREKIPLNGSGAQSSDAHPQTENDGDETVTLHKDTCEPSGLRWFHMWTPQEERTRTKFLWLPLRMIVYIGIYAVVAQLFFWSMIKPWQDNFIEGVESATSVKVTAKCLLLFNFAIQTAVMIDVDEAGFVKIAQVDQITFVWNTVLLLVTNAYVFMQDCFREGVRWDLSPPNMEKEGMDAWWEWQRTSLQSVRIEKEVGTSLVNTMTEQIMMLYVLGEVANVLLPVIFFYLAIRFIFLYNTESTKKTFLGNIQNRLRVLLLKSHDRPNITAREAERAQILVPLLLWMEYTYVVIFPAMAFVTFYLVTDQNSVVCGWLFGFSVIFFIWQRYFMLWLYGKSTFDSQDSYDAFILMWGVVLSMLPPASVWWAWRLGEISEYPFVVLTMVLVYFLCLLSYTLVLRLIDAFMGARDDGIDTFGAEGDPGYEKVIEEHGISWWNLNPVYVLKNRHCPTLPGHEVQDDDLNYWPKAHKLKGFFELGKEFKQTPFDPDFCPQPTERPTPAQRAQPAPQAPVLGHHAAVTTAQVAPMTMEHRTMSAKQFLARPYAPGQDGRPHTGASPRVDNRVAQSLRVQGVPVVTTPKSTTSGAVSVGSSPPSPPLSTAGRPRPMPTVVHAAHAAPVTRPYMAQGSSAPPIVALRQASGTPVVTTAPGVHPAAQRWAGAQPVVTAPIRPVLMTTAAVPQPRPVAGGRPAFVAAPQARVAQAPQAMSAVPRSIRRQSPQP